MPDQNSEQQEIVSQLEIALRVSGIQDTQASISEIIASEKDLLNNTSLLIAKYNTLDNAIKELVKRHKERTREVEKSKSESDFLNKTIVGYGLLAGKIYEATGAIKQLVVPRSFGSAIEQTIEYNKSLLSASAGTNRLGIGLSYLENSLKATAASVSLTKQETIGLFDKFQEGMRFVSLQQFEGILKRARNIVGSNAEAISRMSQSIADLSQEFPSLASGLADLARSGSNLDRVEKNSLQNRIRSLYFIGQISDAQYKQISSYISGNNQLTSADKSRQAAMQTQINLVQDYKRMVESVKLAWGDDLLKSIQLVINYVDRLKAGTESWKMAALKGAGLVAGSVAAAYAVGGVGKSVGRGLLSGMGSILGIGSGKGGKGGKGLLGSAAGAITGASGTPINVRVVNLGDLGLRRTISPTPGVPVGGPTATPPGGGPSVPLVASSGFSKMGSRMKAAAPAVGRVGIVGMLAGLGFDYVGNRAAEAGYKRTGGGLKAAGSAATIAGGAALGASLGTMIPIPVFGTLIGGAVGGLVATIGEWKSLTKGLKNLLPEVFGKTKEEEKAKVPEAFTIEVNKYKKEEAEMANLNNEIEKAKKTDIASIGKRGMAAVYNDIKSQIDNVDKLLEESTKTVYDKISEKIKVDLPDINIEFKQGETKEKAVKDFLDKRGKEINKKKEILATTRSKMEPEQAKAVEETIKKEEDEIKALEKIVDLEEDTDDKRKGNIKTLKVLQAQLEQIIGVQQKQKDIVSAMSGAFQAQSGYVDELIQKMSITGKIDIGIAFGAIQEGLNYLDLEIEAQKELLKILDSTEGRNTQILKDKKAISEESKNAILTEEERGQALIEIGLYDKIRSETASAIESKERRRTELVQKSTGMYDDQLKLIQSTAQRASLLVELADNYAISVGASVEQRMNAYRAEQKNIDVLKQKRVVEIMVLSKLLEGTDENLRQKAKIQDIENEILSAQIKQSQGVKSMRDAWISAMSAMNIGMEGFTEITMSAEKNTAQIQKLNGAVRSMASGAIAKRDDFGKIIEDVGYKTSERASSIVEGQIASIGGRNVNELPYVTDIEKQLGFTRAGGIRSMMETAQRGDISKALGTVQRQGEIPVGGGLEALGIAGHRVMQGVAAAGTSFQRDIIGVKKAEAISSSSEKQEVEEPLYKSRGVTLEPGMVTIDQRSSPARDKEEENWYKAIAKSPKGTLPRMIVNAKSEAVPVFVVNLKDMENQATSISSKISKDIKEPITKIERTAQDDAINAEPGAMSVEIKKIESIRDLFKDNKEIDISKILNLTTLTEEGRKYLESIKEAGRTTLTIGQFDETISKAKKEAYEIERNVLASKEKALAVIMEDINRIEEAGAKAVMKRQQASALEQDINDSRNEIDALLSGRTKKMLTMGRKTMVDKAKEFLIQKKLTTLSGVTYNMMKLQSGVFMKKLFSTDMVKNISDFDFGKFQGKVEEELSDNPLKVHYKNFTKEITRIAEELGLPPKTILTYYYKFTKEIYRMANEFDLPPEKVATYYYNFSEEFNRIAEQFGIPPKKVPEILFGFTEEVTRKAELVKQPPKTVEEYIINYTKSLERMAVPRGLSTGDLIVQFKGVVAGLKKVERDVQEEGLTTGDLLMTYSGDEAYRDKFIRKIKVKHQMPEEAEVVFKNIINTFESSFVYPELPPKEIPVFIRDFLESFTQTAKYTQYLPQTIDGEIKGTPDHIEQYIKYGIMPSSIIDGELLNLIYQVTQNVKYKKDIPSEVLVQFFGARDKFISKVVEEGAPPAIVPLIFTGWRHMVETKIEIKQNPFDQITDAFNKANEGVNKISQDLQLAIDRASGRIGISSKNFVMDYSPIFEIVEEVSYKSRLSIDEIFDSFGRMSSIISSIKAPKVEALGLRKVKQTLYVQSSEIFDTLNKQIENLNKNDIKIVFGALPDVVEMISTSDPTKPVDLDTSKLPDKIKMITDKIPTAKGVYTEFAKVVNIPIKDDNLDKIQAAAYYEGVKEIVVPLATKVVGDPGTAILKFPDKLIEILLKTEFENKPDKATFVLDDFKNIYKIAYDLKIPPSVLIESKDKVQMDASQRPSLVIKNLDDTIDIKLKETDFGRKIIDISDKTNQSVAKVMSNFKYLTDRISKISLTNGEPFEAVLDDAIRFSYKFDEKVSKFGDKWEVDPNRIKSIRQATFDTSDKIFSIFENTIKKLPLDMYLPTIIENIPEFITMVAKNPEIGKDQMYELLLTKVPDSIVANIKGVPSVDLAIEEFKKSILLPIDENNLKTGEVSAYTDALSFFVSEENISKKIPMVDMFFNLNKMEIPLDNVSVLLEGSKKIYKDIGNADIQIAMTPTVVLQNIAESFVKPNVKVPTKEITGIIESLASSFKIVDETDKSVLTRSIIDLRNSVEQTSKQFGLSINDVMVQFNDLRAQDPVKKIGKYGSLIKVAFEGVGLDASQFDRFREEINLSASNILSTLSSQVEKGLLPRESVKAIVNNIESLFDRSVDVKTGIPDKYTVTLSDIKNELEVESEVHIDYEAVQDLMTSIGRSVNEPVRRMGVAKEKVDAWRHSLLNVVKNSLEGIDGNNIETAGIRSKFILSLSSLDSLLETTLENLAKDVRLTDIPSFDSGVFLKAINDFQNKYVEIIEKPQQMIEAASGKSLPSIVDPKMIWEKMGQLFPDINKEIKEAASELKVDPSVIKDQFWNFYKVSKSFSDEAGVELSDYVDKVHQISLAVKDKLSTLQQGIPSVDFNTELEYKKAYDQLNEFFNKLDYQSKGVNFSDFLKNFKDVYDAPKDMAANVQAFFVNMRKRTKTIEDLSAQNIFPDIIKTLKQSLSMEGINSTPLINAIDKLGIFGERVDRATKSVDLAKVAYDKISTKGRPPQIQHASKKLETAEKTLTESKNVYNTQMIEVVGALNNQLTKIASYKVEQERKGITKPESISKERSFMGVPLSGIVRMLSSVLSNNKPIEPTQRGNIPPRAPGSKIKSNVDNIPDLGKRLPASTKKEQDFNNELAQIQQKKEKISRELDPLRDIKSGIRTLESDMGLEFAKPKEKGEAYKKGSELVKNRRTMKLEKDRKAQDLFASGETEDVLGPLPTTGTRRMRTTRPLIGKNRILGSEEIKKMMNELDAMEKNPAYLYFIERKKIVEQSNRGIIRDIDKAERELDAKFSINISDSQSVSDKGEDIGNRIEKLNINIKKAEEIRNERLKKRLNETSEKVSKEDDNFIKYFNLFKDLMKSTGALSIEEADKKAQDIIDEHQKNMNALESSRWKIEGERRDMRSVAAAKGEKGIKIGFTGPEESLEGRGTSPYPEFETALPGKSLEDKGGYPSVFSKSKSFSSYTPFDNVGGVDYWGSYSENKSGDVPVKGENAGQMQRTNFVAKTLSKAVEGSMSKVFDVRVINFKDIKLAESFSVTPDKGIEEPQSFAFGDQANATPPQDLVPFPQAPSTTETSLPSKTASAIDVRVVNYEDFFGKGLKEFSKRINSPFSTSGFSTSEIDGSSKISSVSSASASSKIGGYGLLGSAARSLAPSVLAMPTLSPAESSVSIPFGIPVPEPQKTPIDKKIDDNKKRMQLAEQAKKDFENRYGTVVDVENSSLKEERRALEDKTKRLSEEGQIVVEDKKSKKIPGTKEINKQQDRLDARIGGSYFLSRAFQPKEKEITVDEKKYREDEQKSIDANRELNKQQLEKDKNKGFSEDKLTKMEKELSDKQEKLNRQKIYLTGLKSTEKLDQEQQILDARRNEIKGIRDEQRHPERKKEREKIEGELFYSKRTGENLLEEKKLMEDPKITSEKVMVPSKKEFSPSEERTLNKLNERLKHVTNLRDTAAERDKKSPWKKNFYPDNTPERWSAEAEKIQAEIDTIKGPAFVEESPARKRQLESRKSFPLEVRSQLDFIDTGIPTKIGAYNRRPTSMQLGEEGKVTVAERAEKNKQRLASAQAIKDEMDRAYGPLLGLEDRLKIEERKRYTVEAQRKSEEGQTVIMDEETYPTMGFAGTFLGGLNKGMGLGQLDRFIYSKKIPGMKEIREDEKKLGKMKEGSPERDKLQQEINYKKSLNQQQLEEDQKVNDAALLRSIVERGKKAKEDLNGMKQKLTQTIDDLSPAGKAAYDQYDELNSIVTSGLSLSPEGDAKYAIGRAIEGQKTQIAKTEDLVGYYDGLRAFSGDSDIQDGNVFEPINKLHDAQLKANTELVDAKVEAVQIQGEQIHYKNIDKQKEDVRNQEVIRKKNEKVKQENAKKNEEINKIAAKTDEWMKTSKQDMENIKSETERRQKVRSKKGDEQGVDDIRYQQWLKKGGAKNGAFIPMFPEELFPEFTNEIFNEQDIQSPIPPDVKPVLSVKPKQIMGKTTAQKAYDKFMEGRKFLNIGGRKQISPEGKESMRILQAYERESGKSILATMQETGKTPEDIISEVKKNKKDRGGYDYGKAVDKIKGNVKGKNIEPRTGVGETVSSTAGGVGPTGLAANVLVRAGVAMPSPVGSVSLSAIQSQNREAYSSIASPPMIAAQSGQTITVVLENAAFNVNLSNLPTKMAETAQEIARQLKPQFEVACQDALGEVAVMGFGGVKSK